MIVLIIQPTERHWNEQQQTPNVELQKFSSIPEANQIPPPIPNNSPRSVPPASPPASPVRAGRLSSPPPLRQHFAAVDQRASSGLGWWWLPIVLGSLSTVLCIAIVSILVAQSLLRKEPKQLATHDTGPKTESRPKRRSAAESLTANSTEPAPAAINTASPMAPSATPQSAVPPIPTLSSAGSAAVPTPPPGLSTLPTGTSPAVGSPSNTPGPSNPVASSVASAPSQPQTVPYPLNTQLTDAQVRKICIEIYPDLPDPSLGMHLCYRSVLAVEMTLLLADQKASEEEFKWLVKYCVSSEYERVKEFRGQLFDMDVKSYRSLAEAMAKRERSELGALRELRDNPLSWESAKKDLMTSIAKQYFTVVPSEIASELARLRKEGPNGSNTDLIPAHSVSVSQVAVGDKVCNTGLLLRWNGTVIEVQPSSIRVRIDYRHKDFGAKFNVSNEYSFVKGEWRIHTNESVDSILQKLKGN